ncbi:MAG: UDP-N-acetylmuramate dehydrogenase [Bryobacteraceae bacterium]
MLSAEETRSRLAGIPNLTVSTDTPLALYTRFGIGGPADIYAETSDESAFLAALAALAGGPLPWIAIGGGTNLIVSDDGYRGVVLRFVSARIDVSGNRVSADAGAALPDLVDYTVDRGLAGLETLAGIPGSVGAAVYGNAGAYGHSISERVVRVRFFDGEQIREYENSECEFRYRESVFKRRKDWVIFATELEMIPGDAAELRRQAEEIVRVRNQKFPPSMKCAGSVFKNLLAAELPPAVLAEVPPKLVREGKVPAAWFLDQVGAKGLKIGRIEVAAYHANLIFNAGGGVARDLCRLIRDLKARVRARFGIELEEEVQYVGFSAAYTST